MHPGSTTPKDKVERHSLTNGGLEGIYKEYKNLANVGGGNAKDVGTDKAATNAINGTPIGVAGNDFAQTNFKIKQGLQQTQFTGDLTGNSGGLGYAKVGLSHSNTKYAPNGRL
jgi:hypothetical protein